MLLKFLKYTFSVALGLGILYLLFKHQDPIQLYKEIQKVEMKWVVLSMVFGAWAYIDRGIRWCILLDGIGYKVSKNNSIAAVSIGYFTNLLIPRAGELSRCTALNRSEKVPVDKLFGTIIVERVIDLIALIALLLITLLVKSNEILNFYQTVIAQNQIEKEVKKYKDLKPEMVNVNNSYNSDDWEQLVGIYKINLSNHLSTSVDIKRNQSGKGQIVVHYQNEDELADIIKNKILK